MTFQVQLKTVEDIKRFQTKIISLKIQLFEFQATTLRVLANEIIVERIHEKMRSEGFSEKIIDGTILDNIELIGRKKARLYFRSEYFSKTNFDVALAREEGTDRHFIEPKSAPEFKKKPKALHGGSKWPYFSKGHEVDGIPSLEIVSSTVREMTESLQDEFNRQQNIWISKNLEGIAVAS
jgi:hypothetical protein